jgi:CRP-like cAMP-binding protein
MLQPDQTNQILSALPPTEFRRLARGFERVDLVYDAEIYDRGSEIEHVYFPLKGMVSLVSSLGADPSLELGVVGNEGIVGLALYQGVSTSSNRAVVQGSGSALRVKAEFFLSECDRGPDLGRLLNRFAYSLTTQISQSALCLRFHNPDQRLCRWLLMTADRMDSDDLHLTQAFLSNMLGVRREAVNRSSRRLQNRRLIEHFRGRVVITDRAALTAASCECYELIRAAELPRGRG